MPSKAKRPCNGCRKVLTTDGYCDKCRPKPWDHKKSRHERGYGSDWEKTRQRILERDRHLCQVCLKHGRVTSHKHKDKYGEVHNLQVDHVIPKHKHGSDADSNLQAICVPCHRIKTARGD